MWKINPPALGTEIAYDRCVQRVRDPDLKQRLRGFRQNVIEKAEEYEKKACDNELYSIESGLPGGAEVTAEELTALYSSRFAKLGAPARFVYDHIKSLAVHNRCPLCGHRGVSTLDHFLPKAVHPMLSVVPYNLIPACGDCNKAKREISPTTPEDVIPHPYYDDINMARWLVASLRQGPPPSLAFRVEPPACWSVEMAERVRKQFEMFSLASLYGSNAANLHMGIKYSLKLIYDVHGSDGVSQHLLMLSDSWRQFNVNCWETVAYETWGNSQWFCDGGFQKME